MARPRLALTSSDCSTRPDAVEARSPRARPRIGQGKMPLAGDETDETRHAHQPAALPRPVLRHRRPAFDDDFVVTGSRTSQYLQVGNAVPPPLARAVGAAIVEALRG